MYVTLIFLCTYRSQNRLELDFKSDPQDILNPESQEIDAENVRPINEYVPEYRTSLREYLSILFLKPRMKIVLRSKPVKTKYMTKCLSRTEKDCYRPNWLQKESKSIIITFGFSQTTDYGVMIYNKNRLIKAYEHVGCQKSYVRIESPKFKTLKVC